MRSARLGRGFSGSLGVLRKLKPIDEPCELDLLDPGIMGLLRYPSPSTGVPHGDVGEGELRGEKSPVKESDRLRPRLVMFGVVGRGLRVAWSRAWLGVVGSGRWSALVDDHEGVEHGLLPDRLLFPIITCQRAGRPATTTGEAHLEYILWVYSLGGFHHLAS